MVTPAVYKAYTCTSTFYLHSPLTAKATSKDRKKEGGGEREKGKQMQTFCVCCNPTWPMHKQKIKQFLHHIYILPSAHPPPPPHPYTQYMQHCPAGAFVHPNNPDETLKKQKKKRTAPYHSYTSSWLLSSMSVVWRDSWFMSNSHQSCRKMLA